MRGRLGILQIKEQPTRQNITYAKFNYGIRRNPDVAQNVAKLLTYIFSNFAPSAKGLRQL